MLEQMELYIGKNMEVTAMAALGAVLFLLLLILFQVTRTRREVHKICKKIRKYFDVVFTDTEPEETVIEEPVKEEEVPVYQTTEEWKKQNAEQKDADDVKLLMEVISEVF